MADQVCHDVGTTMVRHPREGEKLQYKKGPARARRVHFIGGIEEAFLVGLCLDWRTVRKSEVDFLACCGH